MMWLRYWMIRIRRGKIHADMWLTNEYLRRFPEMRAAADAARDAMNDLIRRGIIHDPDNPDRDPW